MTSSSKRGACPKGKVASRSHRAAWLGACWITLSALASSGLALSAAAESVDEMLTATPLVLKDGRIAEVLVETIPFPNDAVSPSSAIRNQLDAFTQNIATDCFLTAQVIGHVGKTEISGRETADIHRLARARADAIQASLIDNGLPAASIASVWDWRFMVQQARVTLWIFRLTAGEDCEDIPLGIASGDQLAETTPEAGPNNPPAAPKSDAASAVGAPKATPAAIKQQVIPAARPTAPETASALPRKSAAEKTAPVPAPVKAEDKADKSRVAATRLQDDVDNTGSADLVDGEALEIVFATNSSFFPEGAGDQLRAFMKTLDKGQSHVLRVQTSVGSHAGVSGASSTEEARRYNAWLAERRFKRVEAWLLKNAGGRQLKIEPSMIEDDSSRRVRIESNPLG